MRELPILFSGPLVRSILAGRKTVTRRPVTVPWKGSTRALPYEPYYVESDGRLLFCDEYGDYHPMEPLCPFGVVGDTLYVRETWASCDSMGVAFRADGHATAADGLRWAAAHSTLTPEEAERRDVMMPSLSCECLPAQKWRPSIHMPRWASRITLEVTGVRVERLQDVTEDEAVAEGIGEPPWEGDTARHRFGVVWDSIYGAKPGLSWAANPWVWAVAFRVAEVRR